jgi:hypothetical protein
MDADRALEQKLIVRLKELARTTRDDATRRALEQIVAQSEARISEDKELS